ncbi:Ig-like domain-containing protein [Salinicoccus bachuensis]|uniref:Ig-like domain-containing protein n=1 Tax=Salinicoccus bachuensis TaxID=3136731 RepID=A0ABZ3CLP9_9STAP
MNIAIRILLSLLLAAFLVAPMSAVAETDEIEQTIEETDSIENTSSEEVSIEEVTEEVKTEEVDSLETPSTVEEPIEAEPSVEISEEETTEEIADEKAQAPQEESAESLQTTALVGADILGNTSLTAAKADHPSRIILTYKITSILNLGLLDRAFVNFYLPPEIMELISKNNLQASYYDSSLFDTGGDPEPFTPEQINITGNQVILEAESFLNLKAGVENTFTLEIMLDEFPPTDTGQYTFYAIETEQSGINLDLIKNEGSDATLPSPVIPGAPHIDDPIHTTSTVVTGHGEPGSTIVLKIDGVELPDSDILVDAEGRFSVNIPEQPAGTEIRGSIVNEDGIESEEVAVTVTEPPDTTAPDAPEIDDVHSNDTIITGSGEAGAKIILTINDIDYEGAVDENGRYSMEVPVALEPGTLITALLVDEAGNSSEETKTQVIEATIVFHRVPETLSFESASIKQGVTKISRQDPDWSMEVRDTRGVGSTIRIRAEAQPLITEDGHTLPNALVYVDENFEAHSLDEGPVEVFTGETSEDPITTIQWQPEQGPMIEVNPILAASKSYSTNITWTIVNEP